MAYMYLGAEVPYRAAIIIEKGMIDGIIKSSAKNLEVWARPGISQKTLTTR